MNLFKLFFIPAFVGLLLVSCNENEVKKKSTQQNSQTISTVSDKEDSLNLVLRDDPNNIAAYISRGRIKFDEGRYQAATGDAHRVLSIDSTDAKALLLKGEANFAMDKFFEAQQSFQECISYNDKNVPCLEKMAEVHLLRKNYNKAMVYVNDALRADERNHYPYYLKGWIYQETGDSAKAASSFQTAVELKPDFYDGYIMLGSLYYESNHPLCIQYFNTALDIVPTSTEAMYFIAMYHQQNNQTLEALNVYRRMQAVNPNDNRAWFNSGYVFLTQTTLYDSAVFYFDKAIAQDKNYYQAYYNRGLAHLEGNNEKNAISDFNKAVELNPDYTLAIKALNKYR